MTGSATTVDVYWMPGCRSCLRMKEFIERAGVPYVKVPDTPYTGSHQAG